MHDLTSHDRPRPGSGAADAIFFLLLRLGRWVFADDDAAARRRGWQIQVTKRGLGRSYRDPRFDCLTLRIRERR